MVSLDVCRHGIGIFHLLPLLHHLRDRVKFLAYKLVRCGHHQYVFGDQVEHEEECFRSHSVRITSFFLLIIADICAD